MGNNKKSYHQDFFLIDVETKLKQITDNTVLILIMIGIAGLIIRFCYFPYDIPFTYDALDYFSYAVSMSQSGHFPDEWALANNGWPAFVSIFFSTMNYENFIDYTHMQRILSLTISVLTIIPIYLLSRKFFNKLFSIVATALFIFNPRIVDNSLLGITEPIYLFLISTSILLFFSKSKYFVYTSFGIIALGAIMRYEGLLLIIPFSIMFFIKFRYEKRVIIKYFIAISIFLLILTPIAYLRIDTFGEDGFVSHFNAGFVYVSDDLVHGTEDDEVWIIEGENNTSVFLINGLSGFGKMLGLLSIPFFLFLIPTSLIVLIKKKYYKKIDYKISTIILITVVMILPAFYAFGRNIDDPRFLFIFLPFLCLLSIPILKIAEEKFNQIQILTITCVVIIILVSFVSMEYEKIDYGHEQDAYEISKYVIKTADGINAISPESRYFKTAEVEKKWPNITIPNLEADNPGHISREINRIFAEDFETLNEFLIESKNSGITHLIVDGNENRANFLNSIYKNENDFPFLKKIYDSRENGLNYHVKIYLIDYEHFGQIQNNDT